VGNILDIRTQKRVSRRSGKPCSVLLIFVVGRAGFEPATNGLKVPEAATIGLKFFGAAESIAVGTSLPRLSHCRMLRIPVNVTVDSGLS
jgi:hypothetical protein